tara:strand:+ start:307 stop:417 length:111 start_codon:yes stop_codon:yes gene_type:complete
MSGGNFDPDKMATIHGSGVPDSARLDREEARRLVKE